MRNIKSFLIATCLFFFVENSHPCTTVWDQNDAKNPCVKLTTGHAWWYREKYLNFCQDATGIYNSIGDVVPIPCNNTIPPYYTKHKIKVRYKNVYYYGFLKSDEVWERYSVSRYRSLQNTIIDKKELTAKEGRTYCPTCHKIEHKEGLLGSTIIETPYEKREIQSLEKGDTIICYDLENKRWTTTLVVAVTKIAQQKIVRLFYGDKSITCGQELQIFSPTYQKWIEAKDLKKNDCVIIRSSSNDEMVVNVEKVEFLEDSSQDLINITLKDHHNFCANGILVHNNILAMVASVMSAGATKIFCEMISTIILNFTKSKRVLDQENESKNLEFLNLIINESTNKLKNECKVDAHSLAKSINISTTEAETASVLSQLTNFVLQSKFILPLNFTLAFQTPHALPAVIGTAVVFAAVKTIGFFMQPQKRLSEQKCSEWMPILQDIDNLKQRKIDILTEYYTQSTNAVVLDTVLKCNKEIKEAEIRAPILIEQAKARLKLKDNPKTKNPIELLTNKSFESSKSKYIYQNSQEENPTNEEPKEEEAGANEHQPIVPDKPYEDDKEPITVIPDEEEIDKSKEPIVITSNDNNGGPNEPEENKPESANSNVKKIAQIEATKRLLNNENFPRKKKINIQNEARKAERLQEKIATQTSRKEAKKNIPSFTNEQYNNARQADDVKAVLPETGLIIDGKVYTKHALEQTAPDNTKIRAEIEARNLKHALKKPQYNADGSLVVKKPVLRNIDLSEVSKVVDTVKPIEKKGSYGNNINKVYHGEKITVIQNHEGEIVTVWRNGEINDK